MAKKPVVAKFQALRRLDVHGFTVLPGQVIEEPTGVERLVGHGYVARVPGDTPVDVDVWEGLEEPLPEQVSSAAPSSEEPAHSSGSVADSPKGESTSADTETDEEASNSDEEEEASPPFKKKAAK